MAANVYPLFPPAHEDEPDDALMRRVRTGDTDAFAVLVDRHKDGLVSYLTMLTGNRVSAEDLAQEAFVRAFTKCHQYVESGRFAAWLYRIATNQLRSEARRRKRWLERVDRVRVWISTGGERAPDADLQGSEEQVAVQRALQRLPEDYKAAIVLREIEGWSYAEIASTLDIPEATARSRVHRGKALLRTHLEGFWTEGDHAR
ncbi:MAG: sigma-70 family RNA polymerase sigma factor [Alphaproteobacteria bacterium]|nr:sigma-70 family RNA polymerase sigma factor [Alphaproteobacteria bacterium]